MNNRRAGSERFRSVKHRRQWLILDANFFQGALRGTQILGNHGGHQLAVEANLIYGNEVLVIRKLEMLMGRYLQPRVLAIQMFPVHHRQNTR